MSIILLEFSLSVVEAIFQPISPIFQPIMLVQKRIIPKIMLDTQYIFHIALSIVTDTITVILVGLWCDLLGGV